MTPPIGVQEDTTYPDKVDMREYLWPVENVGEIPAGAAAALATALEYHCNRMGEKPTNLSTLFIHYNARRVNGGEHQNTGTTMDAAMKAITTYGACPEATWPFDASAVLQPPPPRAYEEAKKFTAVRSGHPVDLFEALSKHYPVAFIARIPTRCLAEAGRTGVLPALNADEQARAKEHPGHAMVLVGYDKADKTFLARNCFGDEWGDHGHCRIPFDVMNALAPAGSSLLWFIANADAATADVAAVMPREDARPVPPPAPAPAQPETAASMAARMRAEIRGDLERDLTDASRRIRDLMSTPAPPGQQPGVRACTYCNGSRICSVCHGAGCSSCHRTGRCAYCS